MLTQPVVSDTTKIGLVLLGLGLAFLVLGMVLMDAKLLAMGNLMFLVGFFMLRGLGATLVFFGLAGDWRRRWRRDWHQLLAFYTGVALVLLGYAKLGMMLELSGSFGLFGSLLPLAASILGGVPYVGPCLNRLAGKTARFSV